MRMLILTEYYPPEIGAPQTRLLAMTRELRKLGHEVEVVAAFPNYPQGRIYPGYRGSFYRREVNDGVVVHRVWLYAAMGHGFSRVINYGTYMVTCLLGLAYARKPDYLFVESPPLSLSIPAQVYAWARKVPFILNVSDLWPDSIKDMGLLDDGWLFRALEALESWSYRKAAFVNAMTEGIRTSLLQVKKVPAKKLLFLPNGVDTERYRPQPPNQKLKQTLGLTGKKVVLYAGTQGYAHGLEHVLSAAKHLEGDQQIHFLFVGDGSERTHLESVKRQLNLTNVTFHNPVPLETLASYFSIAECGLASLRDIPVLEGARPSKMFPVLASGKPIIFIGKGEGARLVEDAEAGIVVPPGSPIELAEAVRRLVQDADFAGQLGMNGRRYVEANLQWAPLVANWMAELAPPSIPVKFLSTSIRTEKFKAG